jgi:lambda repressor-like predicted transcriptional regulator
MDKHYGQIVELTIRKRGFSISELARLTKMNRRSIYNWFNQRYLKQEIIYQIGIIMNHDFSVEFPELFRPEDFNPPDLNDLSVFESPNMSIWKDKYIALLEKYNDMLKNKIENEL